jgi:hypothetical protein
MARSALVFAVSILLIGILFADPLQTADSLHQQEEYDREYALLDELLMRSGTGYRKAEILVRLSRLRMAAADLMLDGTHPQDEVLRAYEEGAGYASLSIEADPGNYLAYYYRSVNTFKKGRQKGLLESLDSAAVVKDDLEKAVIANPGHAESWRALGVLYRTLPGLISFGSDDYAVSLGRKALVVASDSAYGVRLDLARNLYERNWDAGKRYDALEKKFLEYRKRSSLLEKNWFFEGTLDFSRTPLYAPKPLRNLSDREEAQSLLSRLKEELESLSDPAASEIRLLDEVLNFYLEEF